MNKVIILLFAIFSLSTTSYLIPDHPAASEMQSLWETWKQLHSKVYAQDEEIDKYAVFIENYFKIISQNAKNTGVTYKLNKFADLTAEEWKAKYTTGLRLSEKQKQDIRLKKEHKDFLGIDYSILDIPKSVDWREKGGVTPVKNQGDCGSCWAFSTTGALEGLNFVKNGKLVDYSVQQLVDCDKDEENDGCNGGLMTHAFEYTAKQGIQTEDDYPYIADDDTCKYSAEKAQQVNKGLKNITANDPAALKAALAIQPVSVAIEADEAIFQFYNSGVIQADCGDTLDHGVLAVGYGTFDGIEAFIVKNSWDSTWGINGYVLLATDGEINDGSGACGILVMATAPTA